MTDPTERASRLKVLAQGWSNPEISAEWARHNLTGADQTAFYAQVGYNLAHQNPQAALQVLAELQGTERRQEESGQPATAMEWLSSIPFASPIDYTKVVGNVLTVWNLKSQTDAAAWIQNSTLASTVKADLQKAIQP